MSNISHTLLFYSFLHEILPIELEESVEQIPIYNLMGVFYFFFPYIMLKSENYLGGDGWAESPQSVEQ